MKNKKAKPAIKRKPKKVKSTNIKQVAKAIAAWVY